MHNTQKSAACMYYCVYVYVLYCATGDVGMLVSHCGRRRVCGVNSPPRLWALYGEDC